MANLADSKTITVGGSRASGEPLGNGKQPGDLYSDTATEGTGSITDTVNE